MKEVEKARVMMAARLGVGVFHPIFSMPAQIPAARDSFRLFVARAR